MKSFESLASCLHWLERLHPVEIELGLARIGQVARNLGVHRLPSTVVTFAGTNGKGSAVAMTEAALLQLGCTVGCYTSPHIFRFNERVRINGNVADDDALLRALQRIEQARGDISLTYFEFTTLAALILFKEANLEYVLLEVGLGGRLDATNLIDADIAVVTSIALDHQDWLGNDRNAIAKEKLGVARKGRKLLITERQPPSQMAELVADTGAEAYWIDSDCFVQSVGVNTAYQLANGSRALSPTSSNLSEEAMLTALQVLDWLGLSIQSLALEQLSHTALTGRYQIVRYQATDVVLDVAHNPAAVSRLVQRLTKSTDKPVRIVLAMMADKDVDEVLKHLSCLPVIGWELPNLAIARALSPQVLLERIGLYSKAPIVQRSIKDTLTTIDANECLLICGSFYTVAAGLSALEGKG